VDPATLSHTADGSLLQSFIAALLDRDATRRITSKGAKAHTWLTILAPPLPGDEQLEQTHQVQVSELDVQSAITKVNHLVMISFIRHRLLQRLKAAREVIAQRELAAATLRQQRKQCNCNWSNGSSNGLTVNSSETQQRCATCNSSNSALPPRAQTSSNSNSSGISDSLSNSVPAKRVSGSSSTAAAAVAVADRGRLNVRLLPVPLQKAKSVHGFYTSQHDSSNGGDINSSNNIFASDGSSGSMSHANSGSTVGTRECNSCSPCSYSSRRSTAIHARSSTEGDNSTVVREQQPSTNSSEFSKKSHTTKLSAVKTPKSKWRSADRCCIA
jgi:hypothetical protein